MFKVILWDVDGTLLNFKAAEKNAIKTLFGEFSIGVCTDEMIARYSKINEKYWKALERGEMSKPDVLRGRFAEWFASEGIDFDRVDEFNSCYQIRLGDTICFCDNAFELVSELKGKIKQFAVTNGTIRAQENKLRLSGLDKIFDEVFISDKIGIDKPNAEFFVPVFEKLSDVKKDEIIIVGDSLTSDMRGGNNVGIKCAWYNPDGKENDTDLKIDYIIKNLNEIKDIIGLN